MLKSTKRPITNFETSKALQERSHALIPGGAHTYARGDDQYPDSAPAFIQRGKGCHVWDVDGNQFIEYGMGLRAITLGHAYEPVIQAAYQQMLLGSGFTRPSPMEMECAEELLNMIGFDGMVKFGKNGSDATNGAIRLSRAYTGRDLVAICGDHPFFSVDDWFIGTTAMNAGIPEAIRNLTVKFRYNDLASVQALFNQYPGQIACLIMEPATLVDPADNFLQEVKDLCHSNGAVLIFDEMITGFRWPMNCGQKCYGVQPDLCTFGKAMGNGFSISALVGRKEIMELGGLGHDKKRVFLMSLTHGAELSCLTVGLEVMKIYRTEKVVDRLLEQGGKLFSGIGKEIQSLNLGDHFQVLGKPSNLIYATRDQDKQPSQPYRTLFLQETLKRGVIMPSLVVSRAHSDQDIALTVEAVGEALDVYRRALSDGVEKYLVGRPVKPVFRQYN
jgi:glutamate-1-semialdehyde 2,1-aminomutase